MQPKHICPNGHIYYKSSSCPVCPECEAQRKTDQQFLAVLGAPARRALENAGILSLKKLSEFTKKDILKLHGMGPGSLPKLTKSLAEAGLSFKTDQL
jgi:predicted RecB family nuclease